MPVVIKRLMCLDLPTGGLVIGYLGVFGGIWELIEIILNILYFNDYYEEEFKDVYGPEFKSFAYITIYALFAGCIIDLLSSVWLIHGINKKSHKMLLPWLIIKGIALVIIIPTISLCTFVGIYSVLSGKGSKLLVSSILVTIAVGLYCYIYMVIYSLYYYIRDEIQKPRQIDSEALYSNANVQYNKA